MQNTAPAAGTPQIKNPSPSSVPNAAARVCLNQFSVISAVKNFNFLIEHQCPQCGAPAVLDETDRLFTCEYCRVKSYLQPRGPFQYVLPHKAPKNKNLLFFPYWRFKGMLFTCLSTGVHHRFIDISHQAIDAAHFPVSVGLRSQAMKLKFVSPDAEGRFLLPQQPFDGIMHTFEERFNQSLKSTVFHQAHVGETLSIIYSPFYIEEKLFDAVLNRPVSQAPSENFSIADYPGGKPEWQIRFNPALCPGCGWDLQGSPDALVLNCRNCNTLWRTTHSGFKKQKFACMTAKGDNIRYLPFWRVRADISGIVLNSFADLVRLANLPRYARESWNDTVFRFWVPAFKVRPKILLALSRHVTLSQPGEETIVELPDADLHPVSLPLSEAIQTLKINLASFMKPAKKLLPQLRDISIRPKSYTLIYIPFSEKHHEFIHEKFRLAVNKNQLMLAKNL